jgi:hypothetical protein
VKWENEKVDTYISFAKISSKKNENEISLEIGTSEQINKGTTTYNSGLSQTISKSIITSNFHT